MLRFLFDTGLSVLYERCCDRACKCYDRRRCCRKLPEFHRDERPGKGIGRACPGRFFRATALHGPTPSSAHDSAGWRGSPDRPWHWRDCYPVEDAVRAREGLHQEIKVGDAPLDERHPGVVEEVLDLLPPPGGEVVNDDDVMMLC